LLILIQVPLGIIQAEDSPKEAMSSGTATAAARSSPTSKRIAVPDSASLKKATKQMLEKYGKQFDEATTSESRQKLAEELLNGYLDARKQVAVSDDPAFGFVELRQAQELALDARSYNLSHAVIDAMAQRFEIDSLIMRLNILEAENDDPSVSPQDKCRLGFVLMSDAAWSVRTDLFRRADRLTQTAASKSRDSELQTAAGILEARLFDVLKVEEPKAKFRKDLENSKGSPFENTVLGTRACFDLEDWQTGIPMLAQCDNIQLKSLAEAELKNPSDGPSMLALGKRWRELARNDDGNNNDYGLRAKYWFERATPKLSLLASVELLRTAEGFNPQPRIQIDLSGTLKEQSGLYGTKAPDLLSMIRPSLSGAISDRLPHQKPRMVTVALIWLARHQKSDGHWGLEDYKSKCTDKSCTGPELSDSETAATALALLPFLAAGQTQNTKGRYKQVVDRGLTWLLKQQQPDGNLAKGGTNKMYSHALATFALCETYELSGDKKVGAAAQRGIDFIIAAQNNANSAWLYKPGEASDAPATFWQMCALKSGQLSGLNVGKNTFPAVGKWAESKQFSYQPGVKPSPNVMAEGLLWRQFQGAPRDGKAVDDGVQYILLHEPDEAHPDVSYWFIATQYMHLFQSTHSVEWQVWSSRIREILAKSQNVNEEKCAYGSWDPSNDVQGKEGGRLAETALAALTLEVYYRYLGLFKLDSADPQR
jgi:hypothetical protein